MKLVSLQSLESKMADGSHLVCMVILGLCHFDPENQRSIKFFDVLESVTKVQRYEILEGFISVLAPDRERKSGGIVPGFERVIGDFSCFVKDRHIREIGLKIFPRVP